MSWSNDRKRSHSQPQKLEMEPPKQANLQFVDDTWERLLNAMERLEQVTESFKKISASRLDHHTDKHNIQEDELDVRSEVHLQIKALQRVIHPVKDEVSWLIADFLTWFGGREPRELAAPDEYAVPILKCLRGVPYVLPTLPEAGPLTESEMMRTIEAIGAGLHASDKIVDTFVQNPDQKATKSRHLRGTIDQGLKRLNRISDPWIAHFLKQLTEQKLLSQTSELSKDKQEAMPESSALPLTGKDEVTAGKPPASLTGEQDSGSKTLPESPENTASASLEQQIASEPHQQNTAPEAKEGEKNDRAL